jgi:CPA2 family monovalent cation:H+ antiporter-2
MSPEPLTAAAIVALAALLCGVVMLRLRQPAIVGYILAGVVLGPSGLGLVADRDAIGTLAQFGMLMLMFGVGIELDVRRFAAGWRTALAVGVLQIAGSAAAAEALRPLLGWSPGLAMVLGFAAAMSSTAVVIKMLEGAGELATPVGRTTVGILVVQDLAVVPMLLFVNGMGDHAGIGPLDAARSLASLAVLAAALWLLVKRPVRLPLTARLTRNGELVPLVALAWCFGAAALSGLADLSPAYGAFLAGLVIGNSAERETVLRGAKPLQTVLLMVFFLSIGLLLDVRFLLANLGQVLMLLAMVTLFKTALNVGVLRLARQGWANAFLAGAALAQIGEFSFLLAGAGRAAHLISAREMKLVVAVAVLSLALSPLWLAAMRRLHRGADAGITTLRELLAAVAGGGIRPGRPLLGRLAADA